MVIPGVNDVYLRAVAKFVKAKGAFLHNPMPLIAAAKHGTFFGVMGQRGPAHEELRAVRDACADDMNIMRHCHQCRADALGLLSEDRYRDFTLDKIGRREVDYSKATAVR